MWAFLCYYYAWCWVENEAQPETFSSIPAAMWWGVATLTTVGYGDVYPVTAMGKLVGSAIAVLGIGLFALPAGILGSAFVEEMQSRKKAATKERVERTCPHCGESLDLDLPAAQVAVAVEARSDGERRVVG